MQRIRTAAEILAKGFSVTPPIPLVEWPKDIGPINAEEGYQIQDELHSILGKKQRGWRVVDTPISRV